VIEDRGLYGPGETVGGGPAAVPAAGVSPEGIRRELIIRVESAARENLGTGRFLHSRNTALLAWDLCRRFGLDPPAGYLAGIAHDFAKSLGENALLELAASDGGGISRLERKKPSLLHGRAAAVLLRERFGIHNKDVLEAVAWHTEGNVDMGPLGKVLYIADKIEVSREGVEPGLREAGFSRTGRYTEAGDSGEALDRLFEAVLAQTVTFLESKNIDLSEGTLRLLEKMKRKTR
jgi:nicotinate-nucleotide adenylyltransferase